MGALILIASWFALWTLGFYAIVWVLVACLHLFGAAPDVFLTQEIVNGLASGESYVPFWQWPIFGLAVVIKLIQIMFFNRGNNDD